ncbi:MAG TPA: DUF5615 family PIN-like protein [Chloroflexota bacterium]|nr:DUF5615 family PIN-like protein [Chloroflexota bacterium]
MLRLYMDEDSMGQALARGLRARSIDVLTTQEAGMIEQRDADQLDFAARNGRVLCTSNTRDFWLLHSAYLAEGKSHAGIVLIPQQRFGVGEQIRRLGRLATMLSAEEMVNRAEFLSAWEPEDS